MFNEIARRRVIDRFEASNGKGIIVICGRQFDLQFDDLLDLAQALEMISLKLTGKVLHPKFRPKIKDISRLAFTKIRGGDASLYEGRSPLAAFTPCLFAEQYVITHYLLIEAGDHRWDNWFGRLDELIKCLYLVIRDLQDESKQAA